MKKDTYYFSIDANALDDPKIIMLVETLGMEGYGIYWSLLQLLRVQPAYQCPISVAQLKYRHWNTSAQKIKSVILQFELFEITEDQEFFSHSFNRRMALYDKKRNQAIQAGKASGRARKAKALEATNDKESERTFNGRSTDAEQLNKIKGNKRKEKESKKEGDTQKGIDLSDENMLRVKQKLDSPEIKTDFLFEQWFKDYDKNTGPEKKEYCREIWQGLSVDDLEKILFNLSNYLESTPNKRFRKNPETYLEDRTWEAEIIPRNNQDKAPNRKVSSFD